MSHTQETNYGSYLGQMNHQRRRKVQSGLRCRKPGTVLPAIAASADDPSHKQDRDRDERQQRSQAPLRFFRSQTLRPVRNCSRPISSIASPTGTKSASRSAICPGRKIEAGLTSPSLTDGNSVAGINSRNAAREDPPVTMAASPPSSSERSPSSTAWCRPAVGSLVTLAGQSAFQLADPQIGQSQVQRVPMLLDRCCRTAGYSR